MPELDYDIRYLFPLLSDYSINHPRIERSCMIGSTEATSPSLFKFTLICHGLGGIELLPHFYPKNFVDLAIIEEVSQEFPERMKKFVDGLEETDKTFLTIYRSKELPSDAFWTEMVEDIIWKDELNDEHSWFHSLFGDLIHHLFLKHRDWILKRFQDLKPDFQIAYFSALPTDLLEDALPTELPSIKTMIPKKLTVHHIPLFEKFVTKYGRDNLINAAKTFGTEQPRLALKFLQTLKACDIPQLNALYHTSLNKFVTTLYFIFKGVFTDDELAIWLHYFIFIGEKTPLLALISHQN